MAKFIVDTSVWIDFFRGRLPGVIRENLNEGIRLRLAVITDIVRHEIRVGARSKKDYEELGRLLNPLECLRIDDGDLDAFDQFAWALRQKGLVGRYTDATIAFLSSKHQMPLLTLDRYFHRLSQKSFVSIIRF